MAKTVIVGITGSIAAYKAAEVVRGLSKQGMEVHVMMTEGACKFITPLTLETLSGNPVAVDMFSEYQREKVPHIAYAKQADLVIIVPATAATIGRLATGIADDMIGATVLATRAPVLLAPAMNSQMYNHPLVQNNLQRLEEIGYEVITPALGELACGDVGDGRLADVSHILEQVIGKLGGQNDFQGKNILVTAGPTREFIDPIRFISNPSSGKMGYALAQAAADRGANVVLISGPTGEKPPTKGKVVRVTTAAEMLQEVMKYFPKMDIVIKAAAVVDYRPQSRAVQKIKKGDGQIQLSLEKNPDILKLLGSRKGEKILVGFAAETQDLVKNAREKLTGKNLDLIVANDVGQAGAGFSTDTNIAHVLHRDGRVVEFPLGTKTQLAHLILDEVLSIAGAEV
ncbi:MAG: bifunctional phosphopantothenoylcysteine decarboxylase/phosphopantothenate--cysteine ligase CoaBC [Firmicutes bacterium]|nr:bifunctional phosphopantothenoylcysteine decarboxylase/phosphopantothenate--cysteine ligase CoaBC [Bacillota bacterium]